MRQSDLQISTKSHYFVIVISEESSVYLCVTGIYKNICIMIKCKEEEKCFKDKETISTSTQSMQYSITNFWKHWHEKIVLVISGVLLLGGIMGFLFGMIFARKRTEAKTLLRRQRLRINLKGVQAMGWFLARV